MNEIKRGFIILLVLIGVIYISQFFNSIFVMEEVSSEELVIKSDMSVRMFLKENSLPEKFAVGALNIKTGDFGKNIKDIGIEKEEIIKKYAIFHEESTKNFKKIIIKFALWICFLIIMYFYLSKNMVSYRNRTLFYGISFVLFGVILGSDPSSMGTVKDAIVLYGQHKVIFGPRMVAMICFFISVLFANKFICAWGCQVGTLQDFMFNMNRKKDFRSVFFKQFKVNFMFSNTIRVLFFISILYFAFSKGIDIVETIDPFKIFKFNKVVEYGLYFIPGIFILSLFVYRPWCTFFCPFGLLSWILEKFSFKHIRVDFKKCINCRQCEKDCPSNAMKAILDGKKCGADCFSCGICQEVCPTKAIEFK